MSGSLNPICHSRRAAQGAAREGNPLGEDCALAFDEWIPFPLHGYRHARPGMTSVVYDRAVSAHLPSVRPRACALRRTPPPQAGEEKSAGDAIVFLPRKRGRGRDRLFAGRDRGGGAR
mgnify:CR=1 FL=1